MGGARAIVTLSIMATGTFLIVLILLSDHWPVAPLLVLIGRLLQGRRRRAGRVSVYLAEIATPGRKALHQLAVGQSAGCHHGGSRDGFALNAVLEPSAISDWGWRIRLSAA